METGRREVFDIVILDTAGRLSIDAALMEEVRAIRAATNPVETLLVVDAMTGQDAVNTARAFNDAVGVTGIVMTRMDGDARGGAALSMRAVTGAPIKLTGSGEKLDALEEFHPERVAGRILGLGDVVGLVEKAAETIDQAEAAAPDHQDGQPVQHPRHAARCQQADRPAGRVQAGHENPEASGGDHLVDDGEGAAGAGHHQGQPQEAHRRRLRHLGAGGQPAAQAVRRHEHDDEADDQAGPEGADAPWAVGLDAKGRDARRRRPAAVLNIDTGD
jgi:hypothetical protein